MIASLGSEPEVREIEVPKPVAKMKQGSFTRPKLVEELHAPSKSSLEDDGVTPCSSKVALYREAGYWDFRFRRESEYEWLANYEKLRPMLRALLPLDARILLVGTGNSPLPLDMLRDGYSNIVATDIAEAAVLRMRERLEQVLRGEEQGREGMSIVMGAAVTASTDASSLGGERKEEPKEGETERGALVEAVVGGGEMAGHTGAGGRTYCTCGLVIEQADALALPYAAGSFDAILDKAMMDALLAGGGDAWAPPRHLLEVGWRAMEESKRVLRPGGLYLQVSFAQPHFRKPFLQGYDPAAGGVAGGSAGEDVDGAGYEGGEVDSTDSEDEDSLGPLAALAGAADAMQADEEEQEAVEEKEDATGGADQGAGAGDSGGEDADSDAITKASGNTETGAYTDEGEGEDAGAGAGEGTAEGQSTGGQSIPMSVELDWSGSGCAEVDGGWVCEPYSSGSCTTSASAETESQGAPSNGLPRVHVLDVPAGMGYFLFVMKRGTAAWERGDS